MVPLRNGQNARQGTGFRRNISSCTGPHPWPLARHCPLQKWEDAKVIRHPTNHAFDCNLNESWIRGSHVCLDRSAIESFCFPPGELLDWHDVGFSSTKPQTSQIKTLQKWGCIKTPLPFAHSKFVIVFFPIIVFPYAGIKLEILYHVVLQSYWWMTTAGHRSRTGDLRGKNYQNWREHFFLHRATPVATGKTLSTSKAGRCKSNSSSYQSCFWLQSEWGLNPGVTCVLRQIGYRIFLFSARRTVRLTWRWLLFYEAANKSDQNTATILNHWMELKVAIPRQKIGRHDHHHMRRWKKKYLRPKTKKTFDQRKMKIKCDHHTILKKKQMNFWPSH